MVNFAGSDRHTVAPSMPEQFLRDIPEDIRTLGPDTRAIVHALYAFESRARDREEAHCAQTTQQIRQISETQKELQQAVKEIVSGFPGGDPHAHRRYHESVIEWRELRNRMVRDALIHAAKVGGLAGACWVAYAIWTAFKLEIIR